MAKGNMDNLVPNEDRTPEERRANARKAGKASARARRERKTIQKLANELFSQPCAESSVFAELAEKVGLESAKSIKELFVIVCAANTLKKGTAADLLQIMELLGENQKDDNAEKAIAKKIVEVFSSVD